MRLTLIIALTIFTFVFTSCDKDKDYLKDDKVLKTEKKDGLYIGLYNILSGAPTVDSLYYAFFLKTDGTMQFQSAGADGNTYYGTGTWTTNDEEFSATITTSNLSQEGVVQDVSGTLHKGVLSGMVVTRNGTFTASFSMNRVN